MSAPGTWWRLATLGVVSLAGCAGASTPVDVHEPRRAERPPLAASDTADTAPVDPGHSDTAPADSAPAGTGPVDTGPIDTGRANTAPTDTAADTGLRIPLRAPPSPSRAGAIALPPTVPWNVQITADPPEIIADGVATTTLTLRATRADGSVIPDGTPLSLTSDLGAITALGPLQGGTATATLRSGTWPGTATVTASLGEAPATGVVPFTTGRPVSVQLHLHGSLSEGNGRMTDQIGAAEAWGVDAVWWTDHDFSYAPDPTYVLDGLDFESGSLHTSVQGWPSTDSVKVRLERVGTPTLDHVRTKVGSSSAWSGSYGLRFAGVGTDPSSQTDAALVVEMSPRLNYRSLLADVSLSYAFRPAQDTPGTELWVTVPLSARKAASEDFPDTWRAIHFVHSDQDYAALSDDTQIYVDVDGVADVWSTVSADLTALVDAAWPELRGDLHAELILMRIAATGTVDVAYDLDAFAWPHAVDATELRLRQRDFLDATATPVVQLIGQEVSFLREGHFNAFGETLPFFAYSDSDDWTAEEAVQIFREAGGLVSYNHMFGVDGDVGTEAERAEAVDAAIRELVDREVYGCDLLEVGYRTRLGALQDFLTVWDAISVADIFVTAEGASDSHNETEWLESHNNFVTWVPVSAVEEADITHALARGMAWFGDPSAFTGGHVDVSFTVPEARATMGQVVLGATAPMEAVFSASDLEAGWRIEAVEDGEVTASWTVTADGETSVTHTVDPSGGVVLRFQVLDASPSGILFTNPIWFRDTAPASLPRARVPAP